MVCSPFEQISSLDVLGVFCVREKVFNFNISSFFTQKRKYPRDRVPLIIYVDSALFLILVRPELGLIHRRWHVKTGAK